MRKPQLVYVYLSVIVVGTCVMADSEEERRDYMFQLSDLVIHIITKKSDVTETVIVDAHKKG